MRQRGARNLVMVLILAFTTACGDNPAAPRDPGIVEVVIHSDGGDLDDFFELAIGLLHRLIPNNTTMQLSVPAGTQTVRLLQIADNCTLIGANPVTVTVESKKRVQVEFRVSCVPTGMEVTTRTTGVEPPDNYDLMVNGVPRGLTGVNGILSLGYMTPGVYEVTLGIRGPNCSIAGASTISVTITTGSVAKIAFDVVCQAIARPEKIAFVYDSLPGLQNEYIAIANPDGSGIAFIGIGDSPSWSRDGKTLAFARFNCPFYYYYYYYDCQRQLLLFDPERIRQSGLNLSVSVGQLAWSPVEDLIAFSDDGTGLLYTVRLDFGSATLVSVEGNPYTSAPSWSPDGQRIVMSCELAQHTDICIVGKDGTGFLKLASEGVRQLDPAWSPDGNTIAFVSAQTNGAPPQIATMNPDGSDVRILAPGTYPSWSRDGTRIIFSGADGLFTMRRDGSEKTRLTNGKHYAPAWRP